MLNPVIERLKKIVLLSDTEKTTRFDILDGFRGLLAISVVIQHTIALLRSYGEYLQFNLVGTYIAVPSFFVLSTFLLTYKMFDQMCKSNCEFKEVLLIVIKYFIRRLFRIYVPYAVFCIYVKYNFTYSTYFGLKYDSLKSLLTLKSVGPNHLWTIPPEVKYYLFIPIFVFITCKVQRFFILWISLIIIL